MEKTRDVVQIVEHGVRRIHAAYLLAASLGEDSARLFDAKFYEEWLDHLEEKCADIKPEYINAALAKVWHTVQGIMIRGVEERRGLPHNKSGIRDGGGAIREQLKALEVLIFELLAGSKRSLHIDGDEVRLWEERIAIWLDLKPDEAEYAHGLIWETYIEAIRKVGGLGSKPAKEDDKVTGSRELAASSAQDQNVDSANDDHAEKSSGNGLDTSGPGSRSRVAAAAAQHTTSPRH